MSYWSTYLLGCELILINIFKVHIDRTLFGRSMNWIYNMGLDVDTTNTRKIYLLESNSQVQDWKAVKIRVVWHHPQLTTPLPFSCACAVTWYLQEWAQSWVHTCAVDRNQESPGTRMVKKLLTATSITSVILEVRVSLWREVKIIRTFKGIFIWKFEWVEQVAGAPRKKYQMVHIIVRRPWHDSCSAAFRCPDSRVSGSYPMGVLARVRYRRTAYILGICQRCLHMYVLSTSKKRTSGFLVKSFGDCCGILLFTCGAISRPPHSYSRVD